MSPVPATAPFRLGPAREHPKITFWTLLSNLSISLSATKGTTKLLTILFLHFSVFVNIPFHFPSDFQVGLYLLSFRGSCTKVIEKNNPRNCFQMYEELEADCE